MSTTSPDLPTRTGVNTRLPQSSHARTAEGDAGTLRRGSYEQGKALETLGHALEYLVDSRMFLIDEPAMPADAEAVQILAGLSRAVFAECAEARPLRRRWRDWVIGRSANAIGTPHSVR